MSKAVFFHISILLLLAEFSRWDDGVLSCCCCCCSSKSNSFTRKKDTIQTQIGYHGLQHKISNLSSIISAKCVLFCLHIFSRLKKLYDTRFRYSKGNIVTTISF